MDYFIVAIAHHWQSLLISAGITALHEAHHIRKGNHHLTLSGLVARGYRRLRPAPRVGVSLVKHR